MKLVRDILSLKFKDKKSNREIARIHSTSKSTVGTYIVRAKLGGVDSLEILNSLDDEKLRSIIFPLQIQSTRDIEIDFEWVHKELARPNVTLMLLWKELTLNSNIFYKYSWFCDRFRDWKKSKELTMKVIHKAGEKLFIDYAGTTVPVVVDSKTGEIKDAQIFVCCLGASQLTYIEATWTQSSKDFINSNINSFEFFGGIPQLLVPDNLKAGVNIASKYEPVINQSYRAMAKYYGCTVIPARAYRPKDKAKVENAVLIASRWILARLRDQKFFSLHELNTALWELLEEFNNNKFQKLNATRRGLFENVERAELKALPDIRYIVAEWNKVRLNIDYHIQLEDCYYSAPYRLRGHELDCRYTDNTVEFFSHGNRVASHARSYEIGHISTNPEHMPRSHREHLNCSPSKMLEWGETIGPFTELCLKKIIEQNEHAELAFKACLGITNLGKKFESERIENACERAFRLGAVSYRSIKSILDKGFDRIKVHGEQQELLLDHENIRGKDYYQ